MSTYMANKATIERKWYVVDAAGKPLGKTAVIVADLLRGKGKVTYTPHADCGDNVIVINADKVALTGSKAQQKLDHRHSGFPGGLKSTSYGDLLEKNPRRVIEKAVAGMLPHNKLGRKQISKLKVYVGAEHPHAAQQPTPYTFDQVAQ